MGDALGTALGESVGACDGVLGTDGARVGLVTGRSDYDTDEVEVAFADFLICVEMALAALAHAWVFSHHEHTYGFYQLRNQDDAAEGVIEASNRQS